MRHHRSPRLLCRLVAAPAALALVAASSSALAQGAPPASTAATAPQPTAPPAAPEGGYAPPAAPPPAGSGQPAYAPAGDAAQAGYPQADPQAPGAGEPARSASGYDLSSRYPDFPPGYAPRKIPSDGGAPPPGYRMGSEPRPGLWVTGAALFGGVYLVSFLAAGTAVSEGDKEVAPLFIPIVGPWITVRTADAGEDLRVPLVMSGIAQLAGVGLFVGGLAAQRDVFVRSDVATGKPTLKASVAVGPGNVSMLGQF